MSFPYYQQLGIKDCGPACLKMIANYYGRNYNINYLRSKSHVIKTGVSMLGISEAAEEIGFRSTGVKISLTQLKQMVESHPTIVHWERNHFVVVYGYKKSWRRQAVFLVADPAKGMLRLSEEELSHSWTASATPAQAGKDTEPEGFALVLEPSPEFYSKDHEHAREQKLGINYLLHYFRPYRPYVLQLAIGMLLGSIIALASPMLTQTLIDKGVNMRSIKMVYLVLAGQLTVFAGSLLIQLVQAKILLHVGSRMNISMVSDFFYKLFNLSIPFFDSHMDGDLMQRIGDHKRLESLLTVSSLSTIFSVFNMIILIFMLGAYNTTILSIYMTGAVIGFIWTYLFLGWKKRIDYRMFAIQSKESSKVIEMLESIQDIKISNSARWKRWEWEEIQATLYKQRISNLNVGQLQAIGGSMINQATGIMITFLAASSVIAGDISLGGMFAINMIIGQLSSPIQQLYGFVSTIQQARIGMDRIGDVVLQKDESDNGLPLVHDIPATADIIIKNLTFFYDSERLEPVLKNISLNIPKGKVTAIVGVSGSGKTTLLKLLLKFYEPQKGSISLDSLSFNNIHHGSWRERCGVVMQDGRLFNATITDNIAAGQPVDMEEINRAATMANIHEFVNRLPLGYMTEIGGDGTKVSTGQKQRILLARALYKKPDYLFLDEATSSLDANNERKVMENLDEFFSGRTVLVIAHRLSTVKHADQILVMESGEIVESGNHAELVQKRGKYFELVKNQLELGE